MNLTSFRQLKDTHKSARDALTLTEVLCTRLNTASYEFIKLIENYDFLLIELIDELNLDKDQIDSIRKQIRQLRMSRFHLELNYYKNDTLASMRKQTRSAVALIVTAVLVVIAALASVYTAGYVRGECAIMEAEEGLVANAVQT